MIAIFPMHSPSTCTPNWGNAIPVVVRFIGSCILIGCLSVGLAGEIRAASPSPLDELSARPGAKTTIGPIGDFDKIDYLPVAGPFPYRGQKPIQAPVDYVFEFGTATGGIRVGLSPVKLSEGSTGSVEIVARLENASPKSIYFLDPDGTEHPFEVVMVTPKNEAYHLAAPISERMTSWRRLSGASLERGNAAEFKFKYQLGREASVPGKYLIYAIASIPKGATQEALELWSENMLFTLTPEQIARIAESSRDVPIRRAATPASSGLLRRDQPRGTAPGATGKSVGPLTPATTPPVASTASGQSRTASWAVWLVGVLLLVLAFVLLRGARRRGQTR